MKTNVSKMGFPIAVVVLAVAGAFANNVSRAEKSATADFYGRLPVSCQETNVQCSDIYNDQMCTSNNQQLYKLNEDGTACPDELYRKI